MQSGYGGVSELQQFMVDNCGSSLFSISSTPNPPPNDISSQPIKYHPLPHHHHHHPQQPAPPLPPHHFAHFHSIPITQQLFQHGHHQFQLFHHQLGLGLDHESGPENSSAGAAAEASGGATGAGPSFLSAAANFKLGVNETSGGGGDDDNSMLHGDDEASESRLHRGGWHCEEEAAIKEPPWRPLDIDYINRNNKRCKDKEPAPKYCKKTKDDAVSDHAHTTTTTTSTATPSTAGGSSNYKLFSELEAIYKPGGCGGAGGGANQTGSGSALTGDDNPLIPPTATAAVELGPIGDRHVGISSETSAGEDAPMNKSLTGSGVERRKRKRRRQQKQKQLGSIAAFFETLVKQLIDHQESLHRKFLDAMERRDAERASREESWRRQEAAKSAREAAARAHDREIASAREAAIVAFLEKFTGEKIHLPTNPTFQSDSLIQAATTAAEICLNDNNNNNNNTNAEIISSGSGHQPQQFSTSRWPKAEVQALIGVRSGLDSRFQEPGLKGPLWEEVSSRMAAMGFHRSAKRCKEKWENINKYFRKTKDSGKKRPQHSKTCPYFHQLDQLYSNSKSSTLSKIPPSSSSNSGGGGGEHHMKDNSELLDAIVVATENQHGGGGFGFADMDAGFQDDDDDGDDDNNENENEEGEEEGEGESHHDQDEHQHQQQQLQHQDHRNESTTLFFQHLQS